MCVCALCPCVDRRSTPSEPAAKPDFGSTVVLPTAITAAVDAMHCGGVLCPADKDVLFAALAKHGILFAQHPAWRAVVNTAPHEGVIRRLALMLHIRLVEPTGYADRDAFVAELSGWMAWYKVVRSNRNLVDGRAVRRASELFRSLTALDGGAVRRGVAASADDDENEEEEDMDADLDEGDLSEGLGDEATEESVPVAASGSGSIAGISTSAKIQDAFTLACDDVVVDGLLANQRMVGIAKGLVVFVIPLVCLFLDTDCDVCPSVQVRAQTKACISFFARWWA